MAAGRAAAPLERVVLVHGDRGAAVDGIRDHTDRLVGELTRRSLAVTELRLPTGTPRRATSSPLAPRLGELDPSVALVLQYSPFCYGRRGFAPWLPADLTRLRARRGRPRLAVMIHEPYVPIDSWRSGAMGLWQRLQLGSLRLLADTVFASIEPWAHKFAAHAPHRPAHHLPVGSNFPDARAERERSRRNLGAGEGTLVIACLGRDHPGWLGGHVVAAANAIVREGGAGDDGPLLLNLGAEAVAPAGLDPAVRVERPGFLAGEDFAALLAAADLFLAPTVDGVSTRRGSTMAALQHAVPVLATDGPLTDSILRGTPALALTPARDREAYAAAAAALAADPVRRRVVGNLGRDLYEREFDWPVIGRKLIAGLEAG
jgi:glycosyltransferase involved in cell wall biosynthesis